MRLITSILAALGASCFCAGAVAAPLPFYWTDWKGADVGSTSTPFTGLGTITTPTSTVDVTYTNQRGIAFYYTGAVGETDYWQNGRSGRDDSVSPYTGSLVANSPTGTDLVALQYAGSQTLTFSQAIANPVFSFVSLNGNGYAFLDQDFTILSVGGENGRACGYWGCGGVTKVVVPLGNGHTLYELNSDNVGGTEPHGTIEFTGAFSTLTWTSASDEYWNGFTVGVQGTAAEVFPPPANGVPEPGVVALMALGGAALRARRRRPD